MTLCVGFQCRDGLVLAADRQVTFPQSHTFQECKLHTLRWKNGRALWGFAANNVDTSKTVWVELEKYFTPSVLISREGIADALGEVLRRSLKGKRKEQFLMLFGTWTEGEHKALFLCNGVDVIYGDRCEVIGWGDSALSRFWRGIFLNTFSFTVDQASLVAIYMVSQEKKYNGQYVGGDTDVYILDSPSGLTRQWLGPQVQQMERRLDSVVGSFMSLIHSSTDCECSSEILEERRRMVISQLDDLSKAMPSISRK